MSDEPAAKRGRGRPPTLPPGPRKTLRCVVTEAEVSDRPVPTGAVTSLLTH